MINSVIFYTVPVCDVQMDVQTDRIALSVLHSVYLCFIDAL